MSTPIETILDYFVLLSLTMVLSPTSVVMSITITSVVIGYLKWEVKIMTK